MAGPPVIIAYVPVIHEGYLAFFKRYPAARVFVLSKDVLSKHRPLAKDLRALDPLTVCKALTAIGHRAETATDASLKSVAKYGFKIVMPDEDVSHALAAQYFADNEVEYAKIFLRWDRRAADAKEAVKADRIIDGDDLTNELMLRAHKLGDHSSDLWRRQGALIVKSDQVLLEAINQSLPDGHTAWTDGDPRNNFTQGERIDASVFMHAEAALVAEAAKQGLSIQGADLVITTFPCPVCAKLLVTAGINRVFFATGYAMLDAEQLFKQAGVEIIRVKTNLPDHHPELWVRYPD